MGGTSGYELDYTSRDGTDVDAELAALTSDPRTKRDAGRLLGVLQDIAERGLAATSDNVHLSSTTPVLHCVKVGRCAAFYAYWSHAVPQVIFLLGFYVAGTHLHNVGTAAARLARMP